MKQIKLAKGEFAIVDEEDYEYLNQWRWYRNNYGYAVRYIQISGSKKNRKQKPQLMHRQIMNTPKGMETDHINRDTLDNRRGNLRICTHTKNNWNKGMLVNNTSGYKCIFWDKDKNRWRVQVGANGVVHLIGRYSDIAKAIEARDSAVKRLHQEFARLVA